MDWRPQKVSKYAKYVAKQKPEKERGACEGVGRGGGDWQIGRGIRRALDGWLERVVVFVEGRSG